MLSRNEVKQALRQQWIETPSWAYGNTGTRFKVFKNRAGRHQGEAGPPRRRASHGLRGVARGGGDAA